MPPCPSGPISLPAQPGEKTQRPPFSWELIVHVHGSQDPHSGGPGLSRGPFGAPLYILASPTAWRFLMLLLGVIGWRLRNWAFGPQLLRKREIKHCCLELLCSRTCRSPDLIKPLPKLLSVPGTASSDMATAATGSGAGVHAAGHQVSQGSHIYNLPGAWESDSMGLSDFSQHHSL